LPNEVFGVGEAVLLESKVSYERGGATGVRTWEEENRQVMKSLDNDH
jgi:hypothetical protein